MGQADTRFVSRRADIFILSYTTMNEATLAENEHHPVADSAMEWYRQLPIEDLMMAKEAIASTAISGNRLAEICMSTLNRLEKGEPVSDLMSGHIF